MGVVKLYVEDYEKSETGDQRPGIMEFLFSIFF